ncbi:uncharacterized protein G2W53_007750 [Senna tora]|uniref:Uncharacterized protein n=1 Tax=Senna tora TaxID=362788 RepID=A0A834X744_9FABA|nr:uncharacterized protein G2W53_007750 [Senna tora]
MKMQGFVLTPLFGVVTSIVSVLALFVYHRCKQSHVEEIELQGGLDLEYTKVPNQPLIIGAQVTFVKFTWLTLSIGEGQCREKEGDGDDFFSCSGKNMDKTNKEVKCLL